MSILKILQYPNLGLKRVAGQVSFPLDKRNQDLIRDLKDSIKDARQAAALSASQMDIPNPPRIVAINKNCNEPRAAYDFLILINPEILEAIGETTGEEGCMSVFPEFISAKVKRAEKIKVKYNDQDGREIIEDYDDFLARCIQHEVDHLNGIIYLDRLSKLKRSFVEKQIRKLLK